MGDHTTTESLGWQVQDRVFDTRAPGLAGVVARFRTLLAQLAVNRRIRHLLNQQNRFNQVIAAQLIDRDVESIELKHDLAQLTVHVVQLRRRLDQQEALLQKLQA